MAGKSEGQLPGARPILLFVCDLTSEVKSTLQKGLEKMGLPIDIFDIRQDKTSTDGTKEPITPKRVIVSGIEAFDAARIGLSKLGTIIYAIPDVNLFIPDQKKYRGLGTLVAGYLRTICDIEDEVLQPEGTVDIDPRDALLPPPKDPLTLEEVKKFFQERFPKDPYLFTSNGTEVAIYLDDPPGNMPIEFSLEEFYTILKLVEVTRAKSIRWKPIIREEEDVVSE